MLALRTKLCCCCSARRNSSSPCPGKKLGPRHRQLTVVTLAPAHVGFSSSVTFIPAHWQARITALSLVILCSLLSGSRSEHALCPSGHGQPRLFGAQFGLLIEQPQP